MGQCKETIRCSEGLFLCSEGEWSRLLAPILCTVNLGCEVTVAFGMGQPRGYEHYGLFLVRNHLAA